MKSSKQKPSKPMDVWVEPEPIVQPAGTTGYPIGTPPPQKLLPKGRRKGPFSGLTGLGNHASALSKRPGLVREMRSRSVDLDESSKSPDEFDMKRETPETKSKSQTPSGTPNEDQPASPDANGSLKDQLTTTLLTGITDDVTQPSSIRKSLIRLKSQEDTHFTHIPAFKKEQGGSRINGRRGKRQNGAMAAKRIRSMADDSPPPNGRKRQKRGYGHTSSKVFLFLTFS